MTVSKYLPVAESAVMNQDEIVARLASEWGTSWFTIRMARISRMTANALVQLGRLDVSKTPNTSTFNYRVRR